MEVGIELYLLDTQPSSTALSFQPRYLYRAEVHLYNVGYLEYLRGLR